MNVGAELEMLDRQAIMLAYEPLGMGNVKCHWLTGYRGPHP